MRNNNKCLILITKLYFHFHYHFHSLLFLFLFVSCFHLSLLLIFAGQLEMKLQKSIKEMHQGGKVYHFLEEETPLQNPIVYTFHQIMLETLVMHVQEIESGAKFYDESMFIQKIQVQ